MASLNLASLSSSPKTQIVVLGTGGTIAGTAVSAADHTAYSAAQIGVDQLVQAIPAVDQLHDLRMEQLAQLDSKDMDAATLAQLVQRVADLLEDKSVRGVVITHGTDTLEETAYLLHALLVPTKPVVLTCAMRPATALAADGPQNLMDALALAAHPGTFGVLSVCAGRVHGPLEVRKVHPYRLDAFSSGDAGPLAHVEAGRVRQLRPWPSGQAQRELLPALARPWPRVAIVLSHAEAQAWMVDALVSAGARGLVVATTGNGTVHRELLVALRGAMACGVRVVRASRCEEGALVEPDDGITALSLSPVKARLKLVMDLMRIA